MITIRLTEFHKDINSTALPGENAAWTDLSGVLREPCTLLAPVIAFELPRTVAPVYNYCYISAFSRYYHVNGWTYDSGLWIASLSVDVLGTYRAEIGESVQYVTRAAARHNGAISDTAYAATSDIQIQATSIQTPWELNIGNGYYVVGIISGASDSVGGISYYALTESGMKTFRSKLYSVDVFDNVTSIGTDVAQLLYDPFQHIVSCMWYPFHPPTGLAQSGVNVGFVRLTGVPVTPLEADPTYSNTITFEIPRHPQSSARGKYLNASPWSKYYIWYPPFGQIPVSSDIAISGGTIRCTVQVDCITGQGWLSIQNGDGIPVDHVSSQVGVPVSVTSVASIGQSAAAAVQTVVGGSPAPNPFQSYAPGTVGATLSNIWDSIGAVSNAVGEAIPAAIQSIFADGTTVRTTGTNGTLSIYNQRAYLVCTFTMAAGADNERLGAPLCEKVTLSTLPGFQLIERAHIDFAPTMSENRAIESFMMGGYFYD